MSTLKKFGFLFSYLVPAVTVFFYYYPSSPLTFAGFIFAYMLVPFIDLLIGKDYNNIAKDEIDGLLETKYFDVIVYSHVYFHYLYIIFIAYLLVTDELTLLQQTGLIISLGVYSASIINVAHELGHRKSKTAQFHSKLALTTVFYTHFFIEHNKGHHVHVATPLDPAHSRKNQNIYNFFIQTLVGGFKSAYNIEKNRLSKKETNGNIFDNEFITWHLATVVFFSSIIIGFWLFSGSFPVILISYLIGQSLVAVLSLETVNYIEHYGMERKLVADSRYERVNPLHSWNANHFFSNMILFNLQRHSDHHAYATRPYQILRHFDSSPQLPAGYPIMMLMSLVPSLWFTVMNKNLEKWQALAYDEKAFKKEMEVAA
jgi:alkane 1-monooxygenase